MDSARSAFAGVGTGRKKQAVWVLAPTDGIKGQLMGNLLPSFWKDSLSRVFGDVSIKLSSGTSSAPGTGKSITKLRKGQRTTTADLRKKAKQMRASGYSYGEISKTLQISRSYAYKLINV